jgi:Fe-S cluster assembly scaffold protein SufB
MSDETKTEENHIEKIPYQEIKDSPTIKYYTKWTRYEKYFSKIADPLLDPASQKHSLIENLLPKTPTILLYPRHAVIMEERQKNTKIELMPWEKKLHSLFEKYSGRVLYYHFLRLQRVLNIEVEPQTKTRRRIVLLPPEKGHWPYHITIYIGRKSELNLEIVQIEKNRMGLNTITVEVLQDKESKLTLLNILVQDDGTPIFYDLRAALKQGAQACVNSLIKGGKMSHISLTAVNNEVRARSQFKSVVLSLENNYVDHITNIINNAPDTSGTIDVNGYNLGGYLVHQGILKATSKGRNTVNRLSSNIIPLSDNGISASIPKLEIETPYAKEGVHSTNISMIANEIINYMRSRGLSASEALKIIITSQIADLANFYEREDRLSFSEEIVKPWMKNFSVL